MMQRLMCRLGLHGPRWIGNSGGGDTGPTSERAGPFLRRCPHCKTVWEGGQVERGGYRTIGDWRRIGKEVAS